MIWNNLQKSAICLVVISAALAVQAQESKPQPQPQLQPPTSKAPTSTYKLDYVFSEMQDGKRINARSYSALVRLSDRGSIRLGNRVPVVSASSKEGNQFQYLDIGVNIDCRVEQELDSGINLFTNVETSSLAPDQPGENRTGAPVIRQIRYSLDNVVPLGKQTLLGSADEVDGTRRLQVEVTVTKVR